MSNEAHIQLSSSVCALRVGDVCVTASHTHTLETLTGQERLGIHSGARAHGSSHAAESAADAENTETELALE